MQFAGVQLVQLPLNAHTRLSHKAGLQAHQLAPAHAREAHQDHRHELVIPARQQAFHGPQWGSRACPASSDRGNRSAVPAGQRPGARQVGAGRARRMDP